MKDLPTNRKKRKEKLIKPLKERKEDRIFCQKGVESLPTYSQGEGKEGRRPSNLFHHSSREERKKSGFERSRVLIGKDTRLSGLGGKEKKESMGRAVILCGGGEGKKKEKEEQNAARRKKGGSDLSALTSSSSREEKEKGRTQPAPTRPGIGRGNEKSWRK